MTLLKAHCQPFELRSLIESVDDLILVKAPEEADLVFGPEKLRSALNRSDALFVLCKSDLKDKPSASEDCFSSLDLNQNSKALKACLEIIVSEAKRRVGVQREKSQLIKANQELQSKVESEKAKRDHLEAGRQSQSLALRKASTSLRKRIFFLKSLNEAVEINDVILMIQEEARKTKGLGDPILVLTKDHQSRIFYLSGRRVIEKKALLSPVNSINEWRQRLADHLNRPIGPLIHLEGLKSRLSLFFEHQIQAENLKETVSEWRLRMVGLELMIDRFQLAHDLSEAALFWEKTFDGLGEPIGIFDSGNKVIRVNQLFTKELREHLDDSVIRQGAKIFNVESYNIQMDRKVAEGSKVVHLSDQSSSFQLKQHMIQTEKIAALGQLAGHIAHELNNPLTGIRSLCQILMNDLRLSDEARADIGEVEMAASRCQNIIKNLLEYSKPHNEDQKVSTNVNDVVSNTLPLVKSLIGRHRSEISLSDEPLYALVDPHMLQQVVFNLIANACQAMSQMGTITVQTRREKNLIKIRIQDTGPGIPQELWNEIFEPFFTTKPVGEGTGLGLSLSLNIIRGFGGDLILDKNHSGGAAFEIHLPEA